MNETMNIQKELADLYAQAERFVFTDFAGTQESVIPTNLVNSICALEAVTDQAYISYEQTVLAALEDVENSMVAYAKEQERRFQLVAAADASAPRDLPSRASYPSRDFH